MMDELRNEDDDFVAKPCKHDPDELVLLYKSYSRLNTDFLRETLKAAGIPHQCKLSGGLLGRGMVMSTGIFNPSNEDAIFYVPWKHYEEAEQIKIQVVGAE